ncbi:MAG: 1-deoxy-D-xylulose-5-phosphate reductoisomerase [bacterium]
MVMYEEKALTILGSTGSIGCSTLDVARKLRGIIRILAMGAGKNMELFAKQIKEFHPLLVSVYGEKERNELKNRLNGYHEKLEIVIGREGLKSVATYPQSHIVVSAISGAAGLWPTYWAVCAGKTIALSNKESLVMAGNIIMNKARENGATILPIDSEHEAIYRCLCGRHGNDVRKIILTASGGPFWEMPIEEMKDITSSQALNHPIWKMGQKVTIDSATMMNKGLEIIEAKWLFTVGITQIDILIHPQCIIHSMVEYKDGSAMALLSQPDMRFPIARALVYPDWPAIDLPLLDLTRIGELSFHQPDFKKFPCLNLAYQVAQSDESMAVVLNAANEVAVSSFCSKRINFLDIPKIIEVCLNEHAPQALIDIEDAFEIDRWARDRAQHIIDKGDLT